MYYYPVFSILDLINKNDNMLEIEKNLNIYNNKSNILYEKIVNIFNPLYESINSKLYQTFRFYMRDYGNPAYFLGSMIYTVHNPVILSKFDLDKFMALNYGQIVDFKEELYLLQKKFNRNRTLFRYKKT